YGVVPMPRPRTSRLGSSRNDVSGPSVTATVASKPSTPSPMTAVPPTRRRRPPNRVPSRWPATAPAAMPNANGAWVRPAYSGVNLRPIWEVHAEDQGQAHEPGEEDQPDQQAGGEALLGQQ